MSFQGYSLLLVLFFLMLGSMLTGKEHLLATLIVMEALMYFLLLLFLIPLNTLITSLGMFTVLLCFAASGAAIGLSLLVSVGRYHGNDMIKGLYCAKKSNIS